MSACDPLIYTGLSSEKWYAIRDMVGAEFGFDIVTDSGRANINGFAVQWNWDAATGTLRITCLDSPWWAACSTINSHIDGFVQKGLAAVAAP